MLKLQGVRIASTILLVICRLAPNAAWSTTQASKVVVRDDFDVVIAGGSTAAFAAAIAAARSGARTALMEPTDWVGGQLTSSGVPAIDEAWHTLRDPATQQPLLNVAQIARLPANITPSFLRALEQLGACGDCWVSRFCFEPRVMLEKSLLPLETQVGERLEVFRETVVKQLHLDSQARRIVGVTAVRRFPRTETKHRGYERLPSADLADWYDDADSPRFTKQVIRFDARPNHATVFVDATEWGELLVLSGKPYLQGPEHSDGGVAGDDRCGQSTVFCFVQEIRPAAQSTRTEGATGADSLIAAENATTDDDHMGYGDYSDRSDAWEQIWTYRRIRGQGKPDVGDLCLQNWGYSIQRDQGGNDYPFAYLFLSRADAELQRADWRGGVDLQALAGSERRAFGWHRWFRSQAPAPLRPDQISLHGDALGTGHGLAKLPYIRDTRRAIGLDGFLLRFADISGPAAQKTGAQFADRIALGAYPADIHRLSCCETPHFALAAHDTLPFYIPFRALTHQSLENLLVAGKTMAQTYLANSATRLHPIEWSSGTACGVASAYMARTSRTSREAYAHIKEVQELVREQTPIDWTQP